MLISLDIETACAVKECAYHGKSLCANDHSLSPWHSKITVIGVVGQSEITLSGASIDGPKTVFRGENKIADLQKWLESIDQIEGYKLIGQNLKFDLLHLTVHGGKIPLDKWVGDTNLMAFALTEKIPDSWLAAYEAERAHHKGQRPGSKHSLKTLAPYFLGVDPFWEVSDHDNDEYVLRDAEYTARLYTTLEKRLKERGEWDFYRDKLLPWAKMILEAELRGVCIDMKKLEQMEADSHAKSIELKRQLDDVWAPAHLAYHKKLTNELRSKYEHMCMKQVNKPRKTSGMGSHESSVRLRERYNEMFGKAYTKLPTRLNFESPSQMMWLLRDFLGLDVTSLDDKETTNAETLNNLASAGRDDVRLLLELRKTQKILGTYLPTYRELAVKRTGSGARIHTNYSLATARTGRSSSSRPNLQSVSADLRSLFVSEENYSFISYDFSAIEPRLLALYTEDPELCKIVQEGVSIHDYNARIFFDIDAPLESIKTHFPQERKAAKECGLSLLYNAGARRIRASFAKRGIHFSEGQCRVIHRRFKDKFSTAFDFGKEVVAHFESGSVLTNLLGRPLAIENPEDAFMKSVNLLIQSSASDLLLESGLRASSEFKRLALDAQPILFVHDSITIIVRDDQITQADEILKRCLTDYSLNTKYGPIKIEVEGGVSKIWKG